MYQWPSKNNFNKVQNPTLEDKFFSNKFYKLSISNDTKCSINEIEESSMIQLKSKFCEKKDTSEKHFVDYDSDDSVKDPDYVASNFKNNNLLNLSETDEELTEMKDNTEKENSVVYDSKNNRKRKRNSGQSYINKCGKIVSERKCVPLGNCRKKCEDKISREEQHSIFCNYWSLGSYNERVLYITELIEIRDKMSQTLKKCWSNPKNREKSVYYFIELNGNRIPVCQVCFLKCFGETASFVRSVIGKKQLAPNVSIVDQRGKETPKNKLSECQIDAIKKHILSFPMYESHYCRRDTAAKYLGSDLTISKMYGLYRSENQEFVSLTKYTAIFKSFNIKFKKPKMDTCNKCDVMKMKLEHTDKNSTEFNQIKKEQDEHHEDANLAYQSKNDDKFY